MKLVDLLQLGKDPSQRMILAAIRTAIQDGSLPSGSRLPSSAALAKQLRVARPRVLRAFARLVSEGLVASYVGRGSFVR